MLKFKNKLLLISLFIGVIAIQSSCKKDKDNENGPKKETPAVFSTTFPEGGNVTPLAAILPHININTENEAAIDSKKDYVSADFSIDGKNIFSDFNGSGKIRGRGNSSWGFPKKPYRIKLKNAADLFGLPAHKSWILLAEYIDGSMLYNSIPYTAAHFLGIPFTNHIIPVQVSINNNFNGVYAFTEHKEVAPNRIDVGEGGVLLELDGEFDEVWKFKSDKYNLPVMVQYPEEEDMNTSKLSKIQADFQKLEDLVYSESFPNNNYHNYFDVPSFINYMIVYELTLNYEINQPRSTYINKLKGGKYRMGIIWDFDWAYGYSPGAGGHSNPDIPHYKIESATYSTLVKDAAVDMGYKFFSRLLEDPRTRQLYKERWDWFRTNKFDQLRTYVIAYAETIRHAYEDDQQIWGLRGSTGDLDQDLQNLLNWLDARANYMDNYVNNLVNE